MSTRGMMATVILTQLVEAMERDDTHYLVDADGKTGPAVTKLLEELAGTITAAPYRQCRGITDTNCNYLGPCGGICNKCGRVHDGQPPRVCCDGGPQWGHAWDCKKLP